MITFCRFNLHFYIQNSGYFDGPWKFENVRENCQRGGIVQFGSSDDPFLPWDTQQDIADGLKAKLFKSDDKGQDFFGFYTFLSLLIEAWIWNKLFDADSFWNVSPRALSSLELSRDCQRSPNHGQGHHVLTSSFYHLFELKIWMFICSAKGHSNVHICMVGAQMMN